jgi:hypothetical protein
VFKVGFYFFPSFSFLSMAKIVQLKIFISGKLEVCNLPYSGKQFIRNSSSRKVWLKPDNKIAHAVDWSQRKYF